MIRIKQLRKELNISQEAVGEYIGMSQQAVGYIENGKNEPDNATLLRLADFFNCTVDYLLGASDVKNSQTAANRHSIETIGLINEIEEVCRSLRKKYNHVNPTYKHHVLAEKIFAALEAESFVENIDQERTKKVIVECIKDIEL